MRRFADNIGRFLMIASLWIAAPLKAEAPLKAFGPDVLLGDIVRSCPSELCALAVSPAPLPGQVKTVDKNDVEAAIRNAGQDPGALRIPARVRVTRPSVKISRQEAERRVEAAVKAVLPKGYVLDEMGCMSEIEVPKAGFEVKATWSGDEKFHRRMSIPVEFLSEGVRFRTAQVSALLAFETEVPTAARTLSAGDLVQPEDLKWKTVRLESESGDLVLSPNDVVGRLVETSVSAGAPFEKRTLKRVPVVRQGERVKLESVFGLVRVSAVAVSRQDGSVGDRVRVITVPDNRMIWARITAPGKGTVVP